MILNAVNMMLNHFWPMEVLPSLDDLADRLDDGDDTEALGPFVHDESDCSLCQAEHEQQRWPDEPPLTQTELFAVRALLEERFGADTVSAVPESDQTSPADAAVSADAAAGESPAEPPPGSAGHPPQCVVDQRWLRAAAFGLREWSQHHDCDAPTYFAALADTLDTK